MEQNSERICTAIGPSGEEKGESLRAVTVFAIRVQFDPLAATQLPEGMSKLYAIHASSQLKQLTTRGIVNRAR